MKIAIIYEPTLFFPEETICRFIKEYIIKIIHQNYIIDLYSSKFEYFSNISQINYINSEYNLFEIMNNGYDIIHNFFDDKLANISCTFNENYIPFVNTLNTVPILSQEKKTNVMNICVNKDLYNENKDFFKAYIPIISNDSLYLEKDEVNKEYDLLFKSIVSKYKKIYNSLNKPKILNKTLKIVFYFHFSPVFNGDTPYIKGLGGTESAGVYIAKQLAKSGNQVTIFSLCEKPDIYDGVYYDWVQNFKQYAENNEIDILITLRNVILWSELKAKIIIYWTGDDVNTGNTLNVGVSTIFAKKLLNGYRVDKIFVVSKYHKDSLFKTFNCNEEKFYVTKNGINPEFYENDIIRNKNKLIYTSSPARGLEILIELFPKIKKIFPEIELDVYSSTTIYGFSSEQDQKEHGHIYNLLKNISGVNLKEPLPQNELAKSLQEAYLMVYPNTFSETSSISVLEAQAAGTPVITTNKGALSESIRNGISGICVDGDPKQSYYQDSFINSLTKILKDDKLWQKFSYEAKKRMNKDYSWYDISLEWSVEFNRLLKRYNISNDFFSTLSKMIKNKRVSNENVKYIYKLYKFMKKDFPSVRLLYEEKNFLSNLINNYSFSDEKILEIRLRIVDISFILFDHKRCLSESFSVINLFKKLINKIDKSKLKSIVNSYYYVINYLEKENYKMAEDLCHEAINYFPDDFFILMKFTDFLIDKNNFTVALDIINRSSYCNPDYIYSRGISFHHLEIINLYKKSYCLYGIKEYDKAIELIEKLKQVAPLHPKIDWLIQKIKSERN